MISYNYEYQLILTEPLRYNNNNVCSQVIIAQLIVYNYSIDY